MSSLRTSSAELRNAAIIAVGAALIVALPSIVNGFAYDDQWIIVQNETVHSFRLGELLRSPFWPEDRGAAMWRPLALVLFAAQWAVGGGSPLVFHLVTIALYVAVAGLVALLASRLFGGTVGIVAGLLFAVHPLHVEVSANVVGQAELLGAFGYLVALLAAWERTEAETPRTRRLLLAVVLLGVAFGLGGKEHVVTFPAALALLWWLRTQEDKWSLDQLARREWAALAGGIVIIAIFALMRAGLTRGFGWAGGIATGLDPSSPLQRALVMLPVSLEWLRLLFVPIRLSADYSPQHLVPQPAFGADHMLALTVWAAVIGLLWLRRDRWPTLFAGLVLFLLTISVVSNVVFPMEVLVAERLLFFPSVGWAWVVAGGVGLVLRRYPAASTQRGVWIMVGGAALLLGARSAERATVWRDNDVFFDQLLEDAPNSFRSHWAVGWTALQNGDSALGERELLTAVRLNPEHPQLLEDVGRHFAAIGRYRDAIPLLDRALAIDSSRLSSGFPLALSLARSGRAREGLQVLEAMSTVHGQPAGFGLVVRGEVKMFAGEYTAALSDFATFNRANPAVWGVRLMAAEAAAHAGSCEVALAQADTALELAPEAEAEAIRVLRNRVANGNAPCK
jgi:tetratricopeptide (TPR) repeat protein